MFILILCVAAAIYSQETPHRNANEPVPADNRTQHYIRHRIQVNYGLSYANSMYQGIDKSFIHTDFSSNSVFEVKYAYFFAPEWGVGIGAGLSRFAANGRLNMEGVISRYNDPGFDPTGQRHYDLHYKTDNLVEQQRIMALEMPLQFYFERRNANDKRGISASLGAKGYVPFISAQSKYRKNEGTLTLSGYEAFTGTWYTDPPHFGKQDIRTSPATANLRFSVDAIAEVGGLFRLSEVCDLYTGVYGAYGFMDILPKAGDKKDFITSEHHALFNVNSLLVSNISGEYNRYIQDNHLPWKKTNEQWNRWQAGIKIGIRFQIKQR